MVKSVTAIIVSWNSLRELERLLEGKRLDGTSTYAMLDTPELEIFVLDNASEDGSREYLSDLDHQGKILLVQNDTNEGYPCALNKGLRLAHGDLLVCCNADLEIVRPDWLEFVKSNTRPKFMMGQRLVLAKPDIRPPDGTAPLYLEGYFIAFPQEFLREVGFWWQIWPGFGEDVELSWRALKRGWGLSEMRGIPIHHHVGTSYTYQQGPQFLMAERELNKKRFINKVAKGYMGWEDADV